MKKKLTLEDLEDYAFYQSDLSAHGCLDKLDSYDITAIKIRQNFIAKARRGKNG